MIINNHQMHKMSFQTFKASTHIVNHRYIRSRIHYSECRIFILYLFLARSKWKILIRLKSKIGLLLNQSCGMILNQLLLKADLQTQTKPKL